MLQHKKIKDKNICSLKEQSQKNRWQNCVQILINAKLKTGKGGHKQRKRADWKKSIKEAKVHNGV